MATTESTTEIHPDTGKVVGQQHSEHGGPGPQIMAADTLTGNDVVNSAGEDLGKITAIMLDVPSGQIAYAVLSFGGVMGFGEKLFATPWHVLKLDTDNQRFILDIDQERLKNAPGFDKDHWPSMADPQWAASIYSYLI